MFILEKIKSYAQSKRIALITPRETLSFSELDQQSDAFAHWLLTEFSEDRSPILIYGEKQAKILSCIFGALKSGRAYVPVDTMTPVDRVMDIIDTIQPKVVLDFTGRLPADSTVLDEGALEPLLRQRYSAPLGSEHWAKAEDVAYILFTSGSTGKPKGVCITVSNLENFYRGTLPYMGKVERGMILNQISYSFDVSGCSLYVGLSMGMTLFTIENEMIRDIGQLLLRFENSGLTTWVSTPSFAEICIRSNQFNCSLLPSLERFLFCGEVLTNKLCKQLAERFPKTKIINTYGPTEATVLVTAVQVTPEMYLGNGEIPIGKPIEGVELQITTKGESIITKEKEKGELIILGESVGAGYYKQQNLTDKSFFIDQITGKKGYRTGDIVYRENGFYYYQGRIDNQLKLNGYRIEIEDIEKNLAKLKNISRAAVIPIYKENKVEYLIGFLLLQKSDGLSPLKRTIEIKRDLGKIIPPYMIPRQFIYVEEFPLNANGKIDRRALQYINERRKKNDSVL